MIKKWEQMIMEAQAPECGSMEELFVLWQLMQQMESPDNGDICYPEIDARTFYIDGMLSAENYQRVVYLLREPDARGMIQNGSLFPAIVDARRMIRERGAAFEPDLKHILGMQRILNEGNGQGECGLTDAELLSQCAVVYVNKRGGKGVGDGLHYRYGLFYIEFLRRQLILLKPRLLVCCGEDVFKLAVKEVGASKRTIRNRGERAVWKHVVDQWKCRTDESLRPVREGERHAATVLHMWNPSYRVNGDTYVSLDEYLKEFRRRLEFQRRLDGDAGNPPDGSKGTASRSVFPG